MAAVFEGVGTRITNIPNDGSTVRSVSPPGGTAIAANKLVIINFGCREKSTPQTPTGGSGAFQRVTPGISFPQNFNSSVDRWWKITGGSEPTSYGVKCNGDASNGASTAEVEVWKLTDLTSPINVANISAQETGVTTVTAPSVTTTVANCGISVFTAEFNQHSGYTTTANSPLTLAYADATTSVGTSLSTNQAGVALGTVAPGTLTVAPAHDFYAMTIAIAPAAVPATAGGNATDNTADGGGGATPGVAVSTGGGATGDTDTAGGGGQVGNITAGGNGTDGTSGAGGGAGPYIGSILTDPLGDWGLADQSAFANLLIPTVRVVRLATDAHWLKLTNLTTDSQRRLLLQDAQLLKDEWFLVIWYNPANAATILGWQVCQAT